MKLVERVVDGRRFPQKSELREHARSAFDILSFTAILLGLWYFVVYYFEPSPRTLPTPDAIVDMMLSESSFMISTSIESVEFIIVGFIAGGIFGIVFGTIVAYVKTIERVFLPVMIIAFVTPKIVLAPLLILWFGVGPLYFLLMPFLFAFFPVMENVVTGVKGVNQNLRNLSRMYQSSRWFRFRYITMPSALPYVMAGLKIGIAQAVSGVIIAELVAPERGIGYMLILGQQHGATTLTFSGIVLAAIVGIILYKAIEIIEFRLIFWRDEEVTV